MMLIAKLNNAKRGEMDKSIVGNNIPYFGEGIISEILISLDVKSLLICKSVCKLWYSVIRGREFVEMHMTRNKGRFHLYESYGESLNSDGIMESYQYYQRSINGLLLEKRKSSKHDKYRICNPSTKEILDIPHPNTRMYLVGMAVYLDSSTGLYNLASISSDKKYSKLVFQVLDLGRPGNYLCYYEDLSWRTLNITEMDNLNEHGKNHFSFITTEVGMSYVLKTFNPGFGKPEIICVDLVQETHITCIGPESILYDRRRVLFKLWQQKPAILSFVNDKLSVWVLEDYRKKKWSDKMLISLTYLNEYPRLKKAVPSFFHADGEDMLVYKYSSVCYVYKLESKEFSTVASSPRKNIKVADTLVSLKGMRPENISCRTEIENAA